MGFFTGVNFEDEELGKNRKKNKPGDQSSASKDPNLMDYEDGDFEGNEDYEDLLGKKLMESLTGTEGYDPSGNYSEEEFEEDYDEEEDDDDEDEDEDDSEEDSEPDDEEYPEDVNEDEEDEEEPPHISETMYPKPKQVIKENPVIKRELPEEDKKESKKDTVKGGSIVSDTVIGKDCQINGTLNCSGFVTVNGKISGGISAEGGIVIGKGAEVGGPLTSKGNVSISGRVNGSVEGLSVTLESTKVIGDITSGDALSIGKGAVVIGDINAPSLVVKGAVKGNVDVKGDVFLHKGAVVKGNIVSASIGMEPGVVVDGTCRQSYANVNMDELFGED